MRDEVLIQKARRQLEQARVNVQVGAAKRAAAAAYQTWQIVKNEYVGIVIKKLAAAKERLEPGFNAATRKSLDADALVVKLNGQQTEIQEALKKLDFEIKMLQQESKAGHCYRFRPR